MKFLLAEFARRKTNRRGVLKLRSFVTPKTFADELARISLRVVAAWDGELAAIERTYSTTLDGMTRDTAADLGAQIEDIGQAVNRLILTLTPSLRAWALRVEKYSREKWAGAVLSGTGVDLGTILHSGDVTETLETVVARNVALIRDVSAQAQGRISDSVFRGLQKRSAAVEVAKEIREATGMARDRSIRIAGDQSKKLTSKLDQERQQQAGLEKFEWVHGGSQNPRPEHEELDGQIFSYAEPPSSLPGEEINCSCRAGPVLSLDD
ncbi:hypothetical protein D3Y57_19165 [Sphingomonas paeninsulae]|uniref:Phage head morphogenesis domain-containing protein n=1 Tax=Sphingomonas paeninsulae TaxID=2319844 RepID=A0A494TRB6_SPHPE|nr:phage minor head protein [Sphingomonas paeninsulae]AYJ87655.1 hypothetical protein D3Y57_19165 [Sphingomonas paeninsulae]